ncbi:MAG: hypothetical protein ABJH06_05820 [Paraglaciecola sp.]|uniref:hypothetical protein n=1 Tax=Paraglaciecola sp. TaxID=1920173 RepID=UPI00329861DB
MSKSKLIIWLPMFLGLVLLVVAKIDLYQFENQSIEVRAMLSREIPIVFLGLLLSSIIFISSFYWLLKKQWSTALQSIISPLIFMVLFGISGVMGGAFLNAT